MNNIFSIYHKNAFSSNSNVIGVILVISVFQYFMFALDSILHCDILKSNNSYVSFKY